MRWKRLYGCWFFSFFLTENSVHTQYNKKKIHQEIHTELLNVFEIFIPPMFNITYTEFTKIYDWNISKIKISNSIFFDKNFIPLSCIWCIFFSENLLQICIKFFHSDVHVRLIIWVNLQFICNPKISHWKISIFRHRHLKKMKLLSCLILTCLKSQDKIFSNSRQIFWKWYIEAMKNLKYNFFKKTSLLTGLYFSFEIFRPKSSSILKYINFSIFWKKKSFHMLDNRQSFHL